MKIPVVKTRQEFIRLLELEEGKRRRRPWRRDFWGRWVVEDTGAIRFAWFGRDKYCPLQWLGYALGMDTLDFATVAERLSITRLPWRSDTLGGDIINAADAERPSFPFESCACPDTVYLRAGMLRIFGLKENMDEKGARMRQEAQGW